MAPRPNRRHLAPFTAVLAVVAATLTPLVAHSGSAAAATATTRSLGPGTNIVVPGMPAQLGRLAPGARTAPRVALPRLSRHGGAGTTAAPRIASGSSYPAPGSTGMHAIDADRGAGGAARVSNSSTPAVAQLQAIQGVTHDGEKAAFGTGITPPDTQVAVSPTYVVEAVNTVALVMDHNGGNSSPPFDLATIWSGVLPGIGTTKEISDPRIVWDTEAQRWFISTVVFDDSLVNGPNPASSHSWIAVAASQGTSPTTWHAYAIQGPAGILLDQPGLGINTDKVTTASSNFDFTKPSQPPVGAEIFVANKSEMMSGASPLDVTTHFDANAFGYAPAVSRTPTATEYVPFNNNGNPSVAQTLSVVAVTGVPTSSTSAAFTQHDIVMCPSCGTAPVTSVPPAIAQPGTTAKIDSGDDRLGNVIWQSGVLWTGGNTGIDTGLGPQAALYLAEVNTGNFSLPVLQQLFSSAGTSFVYPGIALDGSGTPFIAFSRGSATRYMSGGAFAFGAGTGTLMSAGVVNGGAGSGFYDCTPGCGTGVSRWGDYSGAAVDPGNPAEVWTASEYSGTSPGTLNWATVLNRLTVSAPTITSIDVHSSRTTGGARVTVTGTEFDPASTSVIFGGTQVPVQQWSDDHHVVAIAPPHAPGTYDVNAANAFGTSGPLPGAFTFVEPPVSSGYWEVAGDGGIFSFGSSGFHGSTGNIRLNQPIVGMAATPDGNGYWLVASDGGIFAFNAPFKGSTGAIHLNQPIVGMAPTASGQGYWLVASDGGVFAFGDAGFHGSTGNIRLNQPIVGMAATVTGGGYWLVASDGGIFAFGDAGFHGSMGATPLNKPIVGMVPTSWGGGYWMVASDGGIFAFNAPFKGSTGAMTLAQPVVGMAQAGDDNGYWLVARDGGIFAFGDAGFQGSMGATHLNQPVVGMASQPA